MCIIHPEVLVKEITPWGLRFKCPVPSCTVACWDGSTSTPADAETRKLRNYCHRLFDPLWRGRKVFKGRWDAYKWMSSVMGTKGNKTHIGMFNKEQCLTLLEALTKPPSDLPSTSNAKNKNG